MDEKPQQRRITINDIMTPIGPITPLVNIKQEGKVSEALDKIKRMGKSKIVVVDSANNPLKVLKLTDIVGADPNLPIKDLKLDRIVTVESNSEVNDVVRSNLAKHGFILAMNQGKPAGILTAADLARYWKSRI